MENKIIMLIAICIIVVGGFLGGLYYYMNYSNDNLDTNITNTALNKTNITVNTTNNEPYYEKPKVDPNAPIRTHERIEGENYVQEYYQDRYPDGGIKQYDYDGQLIGSSYQEDQQYLKDKFGGHE